MVKASTANPQALYVSTNDAATILHHKPKTLEAWRVDGGGPAFYKIGSRVVYKTSDLEAFISKGRRVSTSDTGRNRATK